MWAIDSSPLEGAGRVEDTYNVLAHAARNVVGCAARLLGWSDEKVCTEAGIPLLARSSVKAALETLMQIRTQDLEPDPAGGGGRIRQGVAGDRRVSIEDAEMRHGRKSQRKRFNGFTRHIAADVESDRCVLRGQCTTAELGNGRTVAIAENEPLQQRLRRASAIQNLETLHRSEVESRKAA